MPDDTSRNKVKLNARVTPAKKQEWRDALEDGETLSSLIQRAVDREIRDEYVHVKAIEEFGETDRSDVNIDTSGIEDRIDELHSTVLAVNSKVDSLAATRSGSNEESVEELAVEVVSHLPSLSDLPQHVKTSPDYREKEDAREIIEFLLESRKHDSELDVDGSAQRLSTMLREPEHKVRQALLYLERETTESVHSTMYDGIRHWVKFQ